MRLYVIRHGESETNLSQHWTGWMDVKLTDTGREDAKTAGEYLNGIRFDKIYSSDLSRAVETAKLAIPGCEPETTPLLREIDLGTLAGKPLGAFTGELRERCIKDGYAAFGGESREDFLRRIREFLDVAEKLDCQTVAAFSHGGWMRMMLDMVIGTVLPRERVCCGNCTVAVFEYKNGSWRLHSWINPV